MSDIIRRAMFGNLGSRLTSLIDTWPRRNYHYDELQGEIHQAIVEYNTVIARNETYERTRRQALKDMTLVPLQLVGGVALIESGKLQKTDNDVLLKHCAAGIAGCWYLRRGKDLAFANDLTSTYIFLLRPLISSQSEIHRKAGATLLSQCFRLKGLITLGLTNRDQAISYYHEAIRYGGLAENSTEQVITNRMMAFSHWRQGREGHRQALTYAEQAYGLMDKETPGMVRSFTASGLAFCQAINGKTDDAIHTLTEARNLFDPTIPVSSTQYTESNLLGIRAQVARCCGDFQGSAHLWEESLATPTISALGRIEQRIDYAKTEVTRDDQPRNMDLCIALLSEGIAGARELDSKKYILLAHEAYDLLRVVWPLEPAVKKLGRDYFGVTK